jgi:uncharacterized protein with NRDE domain
MCTLAAYVRCAPELPLLVAANRDEFLDRPAVEPRLLAVDPWVVGGQDLSAGGTWFGVNGAGLVVGLLNRRRPGGPDPALRSRGLLCLSMLQQTGIEAARQALAGLDGGAFNAFNLLIADRDAALVATNVGGRVAVTDLPDGVHLLTNLDLNDPTCPRIAKSWQHFGALDLGTAVDPAALIPDLQAILADHSTALDPRAQVIDTLCVHLPAYGTRSSSIVAAPRGGPLRYWHAPGPPCRTAFAAVELPA